MPSYVIVDTDVFSYIWQGRPEATQFEPALRSKIPVLSHTSVAEVYFGASYAGWGEKKLRQLDAAIRPYVVVPYSVDMAKLWGYLKTEARKSGHALGQNDHTNDLWIATAAIFHDAPLLTNNRTHFEGMPRLRLMTV